MPLKCIFVSGLDIIDGNLGIDELESFLLFLGEGLPWNLMPGWIYLVKMRDRYSWFNAETGMGVLSNILFSLAAL